jgi:hypothetical protein
VTFSNGLESAAAVGGATGTPEQGIDETFALYAGLRTMG